MSENIIVKNSSIHGKGVFALKDFSIGEVVINYKKCSKILSDLELKKLPKKDHVFVSVIEEKNVCFFLLLVLLITLVIQTPTQKVLQMLQLKL